MATSTWTSAPISDTDANWRLWTKAIYDALISFGWVDTGATGGIDFTTSVKPIAANTFRSTDFKVLRMDDALQATFPVFLKLEFGTGSGSSNVVGLRIQVGTAHNGSGTLTGTQVTTQMVFQSSTTTSTSLLPNYASGTTSRCTFALWADNGNANYNIAFGIERTYDSLGAHNADGVQVWTTGGNNGTLNVRSQCLTSGGGMPPLLANWVIPMPISAGGYANGADMEYPIGYMHPHKGRLLRPILGIAAVHPTDMPTYASTITTTIYGITRTFLCLGNHGNIGPAIDGTTTGGIHVPIRGLLLYD